MKRGSRILIFLVLLIVILAGAAFFLLNQPCPGGLLCPPPTPASATPVWTSVVTVGQPIKQFDEIKADALILKKMPPDLVNESMISNMEDAVGKYAANDLPQGTFLTTNMVTDSVAGHDRSKNPWAKIIQPGLVAIAIPITRLSSMAYGIMDGDRVNIIITTMFVDLDSAFQSELPNNMGQVVNVGAAPDASPLVVLGQNVGGFGSSRTVGRAELDPLLNQAVYLIPSEVQRPRMVSQIIVQDVEVLHIGTFDLTAPAAPPTGPTPTPVPGQPVPTPVPVVGPDIITLIVSPQDAVALTYLMRNNVALTLVLRAPDDRTRVETEAATLQYLLSQYAIPVPAKLPYGIEPSTKSLEVPNMKLVTPTPSP